MSVWGFANATRVYKPGSVLIVIYLNLQLLTGFSRLLGTVGQTYCSSTALLRIEFTSYNLCVHRPGGLLPHLFTLTSSSIRVKTIALRRYISVALVLGSPPAGVTRYPCPVEPGLSSPDARWGISRDYPTRLRVHIVNQERQNVKHLAKNIF